MTTTKVPAGARPPMDRKVTRKSEENRDEALNKGLRLKMEGEVYEARVGDVTPQIARELRSNIGMGFLKLCASIADDPDIDLLSAFVWVCKRIQGDDRTEFEEVGVTYSQMLGDDFDVSLPGAEDLDTSNPET